MKKPEYQGKFFCPKCGAEVKRGIIPGYIGGRELGRPGGAKGIDTSYIAFVCSVCGEIRKPGKDPAAVAKYEAAVKNYERWEQWVASLPNSFEIPWTNRQGFDTLLIDKERGEITDKWQNFLYFLPTPVPDLIKWIQDQRDEDEFVE